MRKQSTLAVISLALAASATFAAKKPAKLAATSPAAAAMTPDQKVIHALNRLAFGPRPGDVEDVKRQGVDRWVDTQLHPEVIAENPQLQTRLQPLDTLNMSTAEMLRKYPSNQMIKAMADGRLPLPSDPETRAAVTSAIDRLKARKADDDQAAPPAPPKPGGRVSPAQEPIRQLTEAKLLRSVYSNRQLEEVLTDFWYNHFNVFIGKGADRDLVTAYERDVIRPNVLGKFKDLLLATAKSPAMLFYLDNAQSAGPDVRVNRNQKRRTGLNENYGRELMELHTLGVEGGYSQTDVTEVARCFTGWTIQRPQMGGGFIFNPRMHDRGEKHVLGVTIPAGGGMEDGLKVIDILARHPSTARFIAKSLATRFVSDKPPDSLVTKMAGTFTNTDGDLREVMRTMLGAPEFWDPSVFRGKVKSPLEMVVSAIRAVDGDVQNATVIARLMNQLGEPLYRKQEPTGYSNRGADWMNSASLLARMNFANALAQGKIRGVKVDAAQFAGDASQIEQHILLTEASSDSRAAIEAGLKEQETAAKPAPRGALVAGLTLGSPDFQRH